MNIAIFGLGYVGCVSAGCLSQKGHNIIGVDVDSIKVNLINSGKATIIEQGLDELIYEGVNNKSIIATDDINFAVNNSDVGVICVGTPNTSYGHLNMEYITKVAEQISEVLKNKTDFYTITIRSTVTPGTNKMIGEIVSKISGKVIDIDFAVISNPEFLREGNAINDFYNPPYTVLGTNSEIGFEVAKKMFAFSDAPILKVTIEVAEMIKFLNNTFHALKVSFANEVGRLCKSLNFDSHELMSLFVKDDQLNISPKYLKPGFSYGGSCLPKDLKALNILAHDQYISMPLIRSIEKSNAAHNDFVFDLVCSKKIDKIGVLGLSFKENTDDLRFSPSLELCERLAGKGYDINIFDENINLSRLIGKNKDFLLSHLPHVNKLLSNSIEDFLSTSQLIVVVHSSPYLLKNIHKIHKDCIIIDLVNIKELQSFENYEGLCW